MYDKKTINAVADWLEAMESQLMKEERAAGAWGDGRYTEAAQRLRAEAALVGDLAIKVRQFK